MRRHYCIAALAGLTLMLSVGSVQADYIAIAVGVHHSLALKADGSIVGWGYNVYCQATPPDGNDYIAIAAGEHHSLALKDDGSIVAWGNNN